MTDRTLRISLSRDEVSHIVGALRERIDGYEEQIAELPNDDRSWFDEQLLVLVPLERRLTKRGELMERP